MTTVLALAALNAANFESGNAAAGQVLTADGAGGAAFEDAVSGVPSVVGASDGDVLTVDSGVAAWQAPAGGGALASVVASGDWADPVLAFSDCLGVLGNPYPDIPLSAGGPFNMRSYDGDYGQASIELMYRGTPSDPAISRGVLLVGPEEGPVWSWQDSFEGTYPTLGDTVYLLCVSTYGRTGTPYTTSLDTPIGTLHFNSGLFTGFNLVVSARRYVALVTQTGGTSNSVPTAHTLEDQFGGSKTYTRVSPGKYRLTFETAIASSVNNIVCTGSTGYLSGDVVCLLVPKVLSTTQIEFISATAQGGMNDSYLTNMPLTILAY